MMVRGFVWQWEVLFVVLNNLVGSWEHDQRNDTEITLPPLPLPLPLLLLLLRTRSLLTRNNKTHSKDMTRSNNTY